MQTTEPVGRPHRNHGLFSDHYLNATLPARPDWQALAAGAEAARSEVARVLDAYAPSQNEAQTEEDLVRPVLRALGHEGTYEVQPALDTPEGTKRPDYVFYKDAPSRDADKDRRLTDDILKDRAFAVGDAKFWERPLDASLKSGSREAFTNKNPSYQISFYMRHAGTEWGILTNGRLWRLYHRDTAHKLDRFYEVDLPALIASGSAEDFLYFFAFFRREAFDDGPLGIGALLAESADYARNVGDSLKTQVYDALRHLAQGFLDQPRNGLGTDPGALREVYDNSLIVLYRLLFVLYAESRDLLPVRGSEVYREAYSLYAIKRAVADDLDRGRALLATSARRWQQLRDLFGIIAEGSAELGVATFDGGLFDPARHAFLEENTVGDRHLQEAIDRLARVEGRFVDYRDLAERHLGTIYEGLLEYHLEALPEPEEGWTVALLNDRGERRATGSYYTPDFVVEYIVEATVDPLLREAADNATTDAERVEAVLALNVLDPSMGSGHFLVEVTERIARFLVELGAAPEEVEAGAELAYWKRRVVQSCVYGVDLNPLAVDLAKLSLWLATVARDRPLSFLDHHLRTGNSLVGAHTDDLRPAGKKRRKKKDADNDGQLSMLADDAFRRTVSNAVGNIWLIEDNPADTVDDVKEQEHLYARLREDLNRRYARLADLATATHFGVEVDRSLWRPLADYATRGGIAAPPQFDAWLHAAAEAARERRFFHWELEFPEVYFDRQGRPLGDAAGFDAVVGNPPYVRQEALGDAKPYLASAYPGTYHGVADLYVYFYDQGLKQLRQGGRMSYIVTNKWLRAGYGEPLRGLFAAEGALEEIVDFGHAPIFPDADVFPCIVVLAKPERPTANGEVRVVEFPREALKENTDLAAYIKDHAHTVPKKRFGKTAWSLETAAVDDLMAKIRTNGTPLSAYAGVKPLYGIKTGLNEAFLIDTPTKDRLVREDPRSADVLKPYLRGQDIKRWSPEWRGLWIIVLKSSGDHAWPWSDAGDEAEEIFRRTYPSLHAHMKPLEARLRKRSDKGRHWWELRSCAYYGVFERPKIMYQVIQFHPQYGLSENEMLSNDKTFFVPSYDGWLLAVLNSPLMWWHNWRYLGHMKDEALNPANWRMEKLPIAPPADGMREEAEEAVRRLISLSGEVRDARRDVLNWLRVEFGVEKPGQKLEAFAGLEADAFVEEVRKRRPKSGGRLTPASLRDLRSGYGEGAAPVRGARTEAAGLENRLSDLVNRAYGLTAEEISLLWSTAPPRMPMY